MSVTGIYFLPTSSPNSPTVFKALNEILCLRFNPEPLPRWGLDHRLFRETSSLAPPTDPSRAPNANPNHRYLQILGLTHRSGEHYIGVSPKKHDGQPKVTNTTYGGSMSPIEIATVAKSEHCFEVVDKAMGPLWMHRQTLQVSQGAAYELDDFRIRIGEVRQFVPRQQVKGCVVEIEWSGPTPGAGDDDDDEDEDDEDDNKAEVEDEREQDTSVLLIRSMWKKLGDDLGDRQVVREFITAPKANGNELELVKQWMEMLRLR